MLDLAKLCRCLCITLACLFVFESAAVAGETNAKKTSDNDALKLIGAELVPNPPEPHKQINTGKNERSSETGFENSPIEIRIYTVKAGDSLSTISKRYYDDSKKIALIAEYNHIKNIDRLKVGQKIKIPIFEPKSLDKEKSFQEKNLAGSGEIAATPIGETDLKKKRVSPAGIYLSAAILLIVCLLAAFFFLFFKRSGKPVTTTTMEPFEEAPFVLGKVEDSENSEV